MKIRDASNTLRTVKRIHIRTAANVSRLVKRLHIRDADNVSREAASTGTAGSVLTASAAPAFVYGAIASPTSQPVYTNTTTATPNGGTGPYTYAWTVDAGWTVANPTSATTAFISHALAPDASATGSAFCTVTDSNAQTADTNSVELAADNYYGA